MTDKTQFLQANTNLPDSAVVNFDGQQVTMGALRQVPPSFPSPPAPVTPASVRTASAPEEHAKADQDLRNAEKKLAEAKTRADADRKQENIASPAELSDAYKAKFEAQRKTNLEAEKQARIDVAKKRAAVNLTKELSMIENEYHVGPAFGGPRCPKCKSSHTVTTATGNACNSCGHAWGGAQ